MDWLTRLETPQNALAILTAMITPAVLISACGALIFAQLDRQKSRARLIQRAMAAFLAATDTTAIGGGGTGEESWE